MFSSRLWREDAKCTGHPGKIQQTSSHFLPFCFLSFSNTTIGHNMLFWHCERDIKVTEKDIQSALVEISQL